MNSDRCPACGVQGRRVKPITLASLLKETSRKRLVSVQHPPSVPSRVAPDFTSGVESSGIKPDATESPSPLRGEGQGGGERVQCLDAGSGYRFCKSGACDIVYFHETSGARFVTRDLRVPVFQKSTDDSRAVCYCFDHTVASLRDEVRRTGASKVPEAIAEKCRQGLDRCEELNPQGACCLGNVKQVVKEAGGRTGS